MIGEQALAGVITGLIQTHKLDKWCKLILECFFSGACTLAFVWGSGSIGHMMAGMPWGLSLAMGFCEGLMSSAAIVYFRFRQSKLTKGMSISVPAAIEAKEREILQKQGITTAQGDK